MLEGDQISSGQRQGREDPTFEGVKGRTPRAANTQMTAPHFAHGLHKPAKIIRASELKPPGIVGRDCMACSWEEGRRTNPTEVYHPKARKEGGVQLRGLKVTKAGSVYARMVLLKRALLGVHVRDWISTEDVDKVGIHDRAPGTVSRSERSEGRACSVSVGFPSHRA